MKSKPPETKGEMKGSFYPMKAFSVIQKNAPRLPGRSSAWKRAAALLSALLMLCGCLPAEAAKSMATPTPVPLEISRDIAEPPEVIRNMLNIAYGEWESLGGKTLKKSNKYTKWRNNAEWNWCAGFVTWCMLEAEVPQEEQKTILSWEEGPVSGVLHCKASAPARLLEAYSHMRRTTRVPQKGYIVLYGEEYNKTVHVGLVYDVQLLPDGRYRLTTIEGNMGNTVKMYIYDYDADSDFSYKNKYPDNSNVSPVPEEEQTEETSKIKTYSIHVKSKNKKKPWYITCFLAPWLPDDTAETSAD